MRRAPSPPKSAATARSYHDSRHHKETSHGCNRARQRVVSAELRRVGLESFDGIFPHLALTLRVRRLAAAKGTSHAASVSQLPFAQGSRGGSPAWSATPVTIDPAALGSGGGAFCDASRTGLVESVKADLTTAMATNNTAKIKAFYEGQAAQATGMQTMHPRQVHQRRGAATSSRQRRPRHHACFQCGVPPVALAVQVSVTPPAPHRPAR